MNKRLCIQAKQPYTILFQSGVLSTSYLADYCAELKRRCVLITDTTVAQHVLPRIQCHATDIIEIPAGETYKTRETKAFIEDELCRLHCGRDTVLLALGGGVVLDLVGFVAATYCRGIPVIYLPTTLLAMVDACIGGKTGLNTSFGKNLIGTFTAPEHVIVDTDTLQTLSAAEKRNGFVEMLKHGLIMDEHTYHQLADSSQDLLTQIYQSCFIKKTIVEQDEHEQDIRQLLNFGHTIGHAIEQIEGYEISHGEAVAIGMLVECYLSVRVAGLSENVLHDLFHVLKTHRLPLKTRAFDDPNRFLETLILDKKARQGIPKWILLKAIGQPEIVENQYTRPIPSDVLLNALEWAHNTFKREHHEHKSN